MQQCATVLSGLALKKMKWFFCLFEITDTYIIHLTKMSNNCVIENALTITKSLNSCWRVQPLAMTLHAVQ